jgi:hypothetical protein
MAASRNMVEEKLNDKRIYFVCDTHSPFPFLNMVNIHLIYKILLKSICNPVKDVVYVVGLTQDGNYDPSEIYSNFRFYNRFELIQLLDSLYMLDVELYHLSKKVFTNTATPAEFIEYVQKLISNKSLTDWYFEPYKEPQDYM